MKLESGYRSRYSDWLLATGWTPEWWELESQWGQEFSLLHIVQTGSGIHPTFYPLGTGGKAAGV
jgi:hypothetical protein